jgi:hypothetical protein
VRLLEDVLLAVVVTRFGGGERRVWTAARLAELQVQTRPSVDNCLTMDLLLALPADDSAVETVQLELRQDCPDCQWLEVLLEYRGLATERRIAAHGLFTSGSAIGKAPRVSQERGEGWSTFVVQIDENVFVENDPSKNCQNYPNNQFETYKQCDEDFIAKTLRTNFGPKFLPIWATNLTDVSYTKWENASSLDLAQLFEGTTVSPCPLPCRTARVTARLLTERYDDESVLQITFDQTVTVTTTDFVQFSIVTFLSDTGGAMGLWLGLGIIQFLELIVKFGSMIILKMSGRQMN